MAVKNPIFQMIVPQRPASRKSTNSGYQKGLRAAASKLVSAAPHVGLPLYSRVIWFHTIPVRQGGCDPDVDNILKPIHDSLKGIVYSDDFLIRKCVSQRVDASSSVTLPSGQLNAASHLELATFLAGPNNHILYIEVGIDPGNLTFGEIQ